MSLQDLLARLTPRFDKLSALCDAIGLPAPQKDQHRQDIINAIEVHVDHDIDNLSKELAALKTEIAQIKKSMSLYQQKMGESETEDTVVKAKKSLRAIAAELREHFETVRKQYHERRATVKELCQRLEMYSNALSTVMDIQHITSEDADISLLTLTALEEEVRRCEHEYHLRTGRVDTGAAQIVSLWKVLGITPDQANDMTLRQLHEEQDTAKKSALYIPWMSDEALAHITHRKAQLEELQQQREFQKEEILQDLIRLWNGLRIDQSERDDFMRRNCHLQPKDIENYANERGRLQQLKKDRVADFITASRKEITSLWDKLYFSEVERRAFSPAFADEMNETVLAVHESEVKRLNGLVEAQRPVLEAVENHIKLHKEIREFEDTTNDPARLFGKGARDPGRLLREEKFRKKISRELPRMERELRCLLHDYSVKTGRAFLVNGEPYESSLPPPKILKLSRSQSSLSASIPVTPVKSPKTPTRGPELSAAAGVAGQQQPSQTVSKIPTRRAGVPSTNRKSGLSADSSLHRVRDKAISKPKENTTPSHTRTNHVKSTLERRNLPGKPRVPFKKTG